MSKMDAHDWEIAYDALEEKCKDLAKELKERDDRIERALHHLVTIPIAGYLPGELMKLKEILEAKNP